MGEQSASYPSPRSFGGDLRSRYIVEQPLSAKNNPRTENLFVGFLFFISKYVFGYPIQPIEALSYELE